jgi:O-antigen/teichoic acid export membrane protein
VLRALARDGAVYAVAALVSRGVSVLLVPLYTRVLTPADFGSFDLFLVFASLVNLTVALEISQGVARFYAAERDPARQRAFASTAWWFTLACYSVFGLAAVWQAEGLARLALGHEGLEGAFLVGVATIWCSGLFYLVQNQFRWELRSVEYASASLIMTCVTAAAAVTFTVGFGWGLTGLLAAMATGAAIGLLYGLRRLRSSFALRFDWSALRSMLAFSIPLVPSGIAVFASTYVDRIMISHLLTLDALGAYGVGFRVASLVGLVMIAFQGALTPLVYRYYRDPATAHQLARIFRIFVACALGLALTLTLFADDVVAVMATPEYGAAAAVVGTLVVAILLAQMYIFAPGIVIAKKTPYVTGINVLAAVVNVALNWVLIPRYGIGGAALATLSGSATAFAAYLLVGQTLYPIPHRWGRLATATASVLALAWTTQELALEGPMRLLLNGAAIAAAAAIVLVTGLVEPRELRAVLGAVRARVRPQAP